MSIPFDGVVDRTVIHDLEKLLGRRTRRLTFRVIAIAVAGLALGVLAFSASEGDAYTIGTAVEAFAGALLLVAIAIELKGGWAKRLRGQSISGEVRGVGVIVEQLDDRAAWEEFHCAWLSENAALLFQDEQEIIPRVLKMDGLPIA